MKIAFVVPNAPGHLNPMTTLALRLQSRNHDVVVMSSGGAAPLVRAADLSFVPCGDEELPAERLNELLGQLSKLQGQEAADFTMRVAAAVRGRVMPRKDCGDAPSASVLGMLEQICSSPTTKESL
jgi:UDP:flavonoid glycosyltransferase YjiC (YdhE family)